MKIVYFDTKLVSMISTSGKKIDIKVYDMFKVFGNYIIDITYAPMHRASIH